MLKTAADKIKTVNKNEKGKDKTGFPRVLKKGLISAMVSVVFTVVAVLIFALIIKETQAGDDVISPVNQVIKVLGIAFAAFLASVKAPEKNWIYGAFAAVTYILISYFLFSIIEGAMGSAALLFSDILMAMIIGIVIAVVFGKLLKK